MGLTEIVLRLLAATLIGAAIGLNRYLHHKSIGIRTLGLIALVAAAMVVSVLEVSTTDSATRVVQGIVTGIGFIGAGLIMHQPGDAQVHGLTTASTVWVAAAIGIMCGLGVWHVVIVAALFVGLLLLFGGRLEKAVARHYDAPDDNSHRKSGD